MKNLNSINPEKLDELPTKDFNQHHPKDLSRCKYRFWGDAYPYKKVDNFLKSSVGKLWDTVYSKYCHLEWIPKAFRNLEKIRDKVILNTFLKDGKVWYYDEYCFPAERTIEGGKYKRDTFYVHPTTKLLCFYKYPRTDYKKERREEEMKTMRILGDYHQLLKIEGIWYEVKAEPIKSAIIEVDGLHYAPVEVNPIYREWHGRILSDITPSNVREMKYKIIDGKFYVPCPKPYGYSEKKIGPRDRLIEDHTNRLTWTWRDVSDSIKITLYCQLNSKELKKHGLRNDVKIGGMKCKKCGGIIGKDCIWHYCPKCNKYKDNYRCHICKW